MAQAAESSRDSAVVIDESRIRLESLITHSNHVTNTTPLGKVADLLTELDVQFLGVTDAKTRRCLGLAPRLQIKTILSGRYGFSLHARKPVGHYLSRHCQYVLIQLTAKSCARLVSKHLTLRLATKFVIDAG